MPARIRRFRLLALAGPLLALVPLLSGVPAVAADPVSGTASLAVSKPQVTYGGHIGLTGSVASDPSCQGGREVDLKGREPGDPSWSVLAVHTTASDGTFGFYRQPEHTSSYRVRLPAHITGQASCATVASASVRSAVRARVRLTLSPNPVDAGACATIKVQVAPSEAGTNVTLERKGPSGWQTMATETLDSSSRASITRCYHWAQIGQEALRALWPRQDLLNTAGAETATLRVVRAKWMHTIDRLAGGRNIAVAVAGGGRYLYERADGVPHAPASNEKLLQSMALLNAVGSQYRIRTRVASASVSGGVVRRNLWILGRGDPSVGRKAIAALASGVAAAGIHRVRRVMGSTNFFSHDWWARGWKSFFPSDEVGLPTALTYRDNLVRGVNVRDPERRAAIALTKALRRRGVAVSRKPGEGTPAPHLHAIARIKSVPLENLLAAQNFQSVNFYAEVLGKLLGEIRSGRPGTIAKGAAAIRAFAAAHGVSVAAHDSSGLSYANRVTAAGMVRLLGVAEQAPWGTALTSTLPWPGHGTLEGRLFGVPMRAKTGTLVNVSALSGWLKLTRTGQWARFSILSSGFAAWKAKDIEDAIVRTLWRYGR